ncbi:MAG TPA: hypothetical protein VEK08_20840, partial [Planctomycetota bacterium]|nr:hypothetical protein [Planctomycetota bacterium]
MNIESNNPIPPDAHAHPVSPDPIDELQLMRYLDGRLEGAEKSAVEELLRTSAPARRRLDALREENHLLREALENISEPSRRLSDKVVAALHNEERFRQQALRSHRMRRNILWGVGIAASFFFCVFLMKPREAMGTALSGTGGTLVMSSGERQPLAKNMNIYEHDEITTAQGQFSRIRLGAETLIDIDERSRIAIEKSKPEPSFRMHQGHLGIATAQQEVTLRAPQGTVRIAANSVVDLWLPQPSKAEWPAWLMTQPAAAEGAASAEPPMVATVISGSISIANEKMPEGIAISQGNRVTFTAKERRTRKVDLAGSRVIETRRSTSWHTSEGILPQDRTIIGLLEKPDFQDLGERLGMNRNTPGAIAAALAQLQDGMRASSAAERAERLAAGQQALRVAYEPLHASDERRDFGRMLEGLAHLERGRALMERVAAGKEELSTAYAAFDAARVAFDEALKVDVEAAPAPAAEKPEWARQIAAGIGVTLRDLTPANQSALLASFNHAVAQHWMLTTESVIGERPTVAAREFEGLRNWLSRSVEGMAARLAHGLVLQRAGSEKTQKAIDAYSEILAVSTAGWGEPSRRLADGLKQAALVSLTRLYAEIQQSDKARAAAEDFWLLYPLDSNTPAAQEIKSIIDRSQLKDAAHALQLGRFELAVENYDKWLTAHTPAGAA